MVADPLDLGNCPLQMLQNHGLAPGNWPLAQLKQVISDCGMQKVDRILSLKNGIHFVRRPHHHEAHRLTDHFSGQICHTPSFLKHSNNGRFRSFKVILFQVSQGDRLRTTWGYLSNKGCKHRAKRQNHNAGKKLNNRVGVGNLTNHRIAHQGYDLGVKWKHNNSYDGAYDVKRQVRHSQPPSLNVST
ncbi:MAG: hypothetical protein BWX66_01179 [Deltaproteobacteria bacterium ADurb.Bin058]|nr:MAG: hypothetical protein BWX66_01179 [Deltaproteobacteria bacterium ADurb.Bin058]